MRNRHLMFGVLMLAGLVAVGTLAEESTRTTPTPEDSELVGAAVIPLKIPAQASRRANPVSPGEESLGRGGRLFATQCAMCHGGLGNGKGELAGKLGFQIPDMTDRAAQARRTDGDLFYIISHGHGNMPKETRISEEWRWDLVNHIRSLRTR